MFPFSLYSIAQSVDDDMDKKSEWMGIITLMSCVESAINNPQQASSVTRWTLRVTVAFKLLLKNFASIGNVSSHNNHFLTNVYNRRGNYSSRRFTTEQIKTFIKILKIVQIKAH